TFIGPKLRMIKSANENIYPAEVERALKAHPAIGDAAVIGVPDEHFGQTVKAIVVLKDGSAATPKKGPPPADAALDEPRGGAASPGTCPPPRGVPRTFPPPSAGNATTQR